MKLPIQLLTAVAIIMAIFSSCNKMNNVSPANTSKSPIGSQDPLVATPGGLMPRSHVHFIEDGNVLLQKNGHVYKAERQTGRILEDFGEYKRPTTNRTVSSLPASRQIALAAPENTGWLTNAVWVNTSTSVIITQYSTNCTVPPAPANPNDGQVLFIFEGLQNDTTTNPMIIQPVLEWGPNAYQTNWQGWGIANWAVWGTGLNQAAVTSLIAVAPGTNLQGSLTWNGENKTLQSWEYTSQFINPANGTAYNNFLTVQDGGTGTFGGTIPQVPYMSYAFETLEAYHQVNGVTNYGVVSPSDYPAGQDYVDMNSIAVDLNGALTSPAWIEDNNKNSIWGENTWVVGPTDVHLYWHPLPTINNAQVVTITSTPTSYPITAYPGTTFGIQLNALAMHLGKLVGTSTATMTITTPGVTFGNGSASFSATNGTSNTTLTMPAGGGLSTTVNVTVSYTTTAPPGSQRISGAVLLY